MRSRGNNHKRNGEEHQTEENEEIERTESVLIALSKVQHPDLILRGRKCAILQSKDRLWKNHDQDDDIVMPTLMLKRKWTRVNGRLVIEKNSIIGNPPKSIDFAGWSADETSLRAVGELASQVRVLNFEKAIGLSLRSVVSLVKSLKQESIRRNGVQLKHINLSGWKATHRKDEVDTGVAVIAACCEFSLVSLEIRNSDITDSGLVVVGERCKNLAFLDVSDSVAVTDLGLSAVLSSTKVPHVDQFKKGDKTTGRFSNQMSILIAQNCPSVRGRWFLQKTISNKVTVSLTWLTRVSLRNCKLVSEKALLELVQSAGGCLQELDVSKCKGTSNQCLSALATASIGLRKLELEGCTQISDEGILGLCTGCIHNLESIDISGTSTSEVSLSALFERFFESLQTVKASQLSSNTERLPASKLSKHDILSSTESRMELVESTALFKKQSRHTGQWVAALLRSTGKTLNNVKCSSNTALESLTLTGQTMVRWKNIDLFIKASSASLKELDLSGCELVDDRLITVLIDSCTSLYSLKLAVCPKISDYGVGYIAKSTLKLRELDISFHPYLVSDLDSISEHAIGDILKMQETLIRFSCKFRKNFRFQVSKNNKGKPFKLKQGALLEVLQVDGCLNFDQNTIASLILSFPQLKEVSLGHCAQLRNEDIFQSLFRLPEGSQFEVLETPKLCIIRREDYYFKSYRQNVLARAKLEENSAVTIQREFRRFSAAPSTIQYILLTQGASLEKFAVRIQKLFRVRKFQRIVTNVYTRSRAVRVLTRSIRSYMWRKRMKLFLLDDNMKKLREELAKTLHASNAASASLQKWYRRFLWARSQEGKQSIRLMEEAKEDLEWRKKDKIWRTHYVKIFKELLSKADHRVKFLRAHVSVSEEIIQSPLKRVAQVACTTCHKHGAKWWCCFCRRPLCDACTWESAQHAVHVRIRNDPLNDPALIQPLADPVEWVEREISQILESAHNESREMKFALGEVTWVVFVRSKVVQELKVKFAIIDATKNRTLRLEKRRREQKLEESVRLVQSVFRSSRARKAAKMLMERQEEVRRAQLEEKLFLAASKIQAIFRGREPRNLYRAWKIQTAGPEKSIEIRRAGIQAVFEPYMFKFTKRIAKRMIESCKSAFQSLNHLESNFQSSIVLPQFSSTVDSLKSLRTLQDSLRKEIASRQESPDAAGRGFLRIALAREQNTKQRTESAERRMYILQSQSGENHCIRVAQSGAMHKAFKQAISRALSQIEKFDEFEQQLRQRRRLLESIQAEPIDAMRKDALRKIYAKSNTREIQVLCTRPDSTCEQFDTISKCEVDWIAEKLGDVTHKEIKRARVASQVLESTEARSKREVKENGDEKSESEEEEKPEDVPSPRNEADRKQISPTKVKKELVNLDTKYDDHNIPSELKRYWAESASLAQYELNRLSNRVDFEKFRQETLKKLLGLYTIHDSFVNEILSLEIRKEYHSQGQDHENVIKCVSQETELRGKLVKLHLVIKSKSADFFEAVRREERLSEAHTNRVVKSVSQLRRGQSLQAESIFREAKSGVSFDDFRGILPSRIRVKHKLSIRVLQREMKYEAWAALLPDRFFTNQLRLEADRVLQLRLKNALNSRIVEALNGQTKVGRINTAGELVAIEDEGEDIPAENLSKKGALVAELIGEAKEATKPKRGNQGQKPRSIFQGIRLRVYNWLNSDKEALERMEAALAAREKSQRQVFYGISKDIVFTVGNEETAEMERKQQLRKNEGLNYKARLNKNLGGEESIYLWVRRSKNPNEILSEFRISHATKGHVRHLSVSKAFKKISHPKLAGKPQEPGIMILFKVAQDLENREQEVSFVSDLAICNKNEISKEKSLEEKGFQKVDIDLSEFGLQRGLYVWVQRTEPTMVGGEGKKLEGAFVHQGEFNQLQKKQLELKERLAKTPEGEEQIALQEVVAQLDAQLADSARVLAVQKETLLRRSMDFLAISKDELKMLVNKFAEIDADKSGEVSRAELFYYTGIPDTAFSHRIFDFFDTNNDGTLDFAELVSVMATFCMFESTEVATMCFHFLQPDGDGMVVALNVASLLSQMNNIDPDELPVLRNAMSYFQQVMNEEGKITLEQFIQMHRRYPAALYPVVTIRDLLRASFFGVKWWQRRLELYSVARNNIRKRDEEQKRLEREAEEIERLREQKEKGKKFRRVLKSDSDEIHLPPIN